MVLALVWLGSAGYLLILGSFVGWVGGLVSVVGGLGGQVFCVGCGAGFSLGWLCWLLAGTWWCCGGGWWSGLLSLEINFKLNFGGFSFTIGRGFGGDNSLFTGTGLGCGLGWWSGKLSLGFTFAGFSFTK